MMKERGVRERGARLAGRETAQRLGSSSGGQVIMENPKNGTREPWASIT